MVHVTASDDAKLLRTPIGKNVSRKQQDGQVKTKLDRPDPQVLFSPSGQSRLGREDMLKRYDEWLKIATENKITAKNTWNVALIDYFSDMTIIKNTEDGQINFQKASCTLDGCVKIYTSRVDSAADEAGQLLHGLTDTQATATAAVQKTKKDDGPLEKDEDEEEKAISRKAKIGRDTLCKNDESINLKCFDEITCQVDILFRQLSSAFDEAVTKSSAVSYEGGGLLSQLDVDSQGFLILDPSAHVVSLETQFPKDEGSSMINLDASLISLFTKTSIQDDSILTLLEGLQDMKVKLDETAYNTLDSGSFEEPVWDEFGSQGGFEEDETSSIPSNPLTAAMIKNLSTESETLSVPATNVPTQPSEPSNAMTEERLEEIAFQTDELPFRYFDKQWAGPEHWKLSHVLSSGSLVGRSNKTSNLNSFSNKTQANTERGRKKTTFDFITAGEIDIKTLFQKPANLESLYMTLNEQAKEHCLLPEDLNINASSLLTYFTKPTQSVLTKLSRSMRVVSQADSASNLITPELNIDPLANKVIKNPDLFLNEDNFEDGGFEDVADSSNIHEAIPLAADRFEEKLNDTTHYNTIASYGTIIPQDMLSYTKTSQVIDMKSIQSAFGQSISRKFSAKSHDRDKFPAEQKISNVVKFSEIIEECKDKESLPSVAISLMALLHVANDHNYTLTSTSSNGDIFISQ